LRQLGAAITAVFVVNLIILAYVRKAFREDRPDTSTKKSD
jgi:hypothetical protein